MYSPRSSDDVIEAALNIARAHLNRGGAAFGAGVPGALPGGLPAVKAAPVVSADLAHQLVRHAVRLQHPLVGRAHFHGGGAADDTISSALALAHAQIHDQDRRHFSDGGDAGGEGDGGGDNSGDQSGGFGRDYGGFGFGGLGGGVGSSDVGRDNGWATSSSPVGLGMASDASTTIGRAAGQISSLGGYGAAPAGGYGGSYGSAPTSSNDAGSIGPSGLATGDGTRQAIGFGNIGSTSLGDGNGSNAGVNGTGMFGMAGLGFGSSNTGAEDMAIGGYQTDPIAGHTGSIGSFAAPGNMNGGYGDLSGIGAFGGFGQASDSAFGPGSIAGLRSFGAAQAGAGGSGYGVLDGNAFSNSVDPSSVDETPSLTVHGLPGFASGAVTGDAAPAALGTPGAVANYALADLAKNFGVTYGAKFGLPSTFGFSNPAALAGIVNGSVQQESSMNPAAINSTSYATGLNQMMGAGTWGKTNPGPYTGLASDPAADRQSAMLGFIAGQAGVDPSTLDARVVGPEAAAQALASLPGVYNNELAFGLGQMATNPLYARSFGAVENAFAPISSLEKTYTNNFEGPQTGVNMAARQAAATAINDSVNAQIADLGLSSPSVVAGVSGQGYAPTTVAGALQVANAARFDGAPDEGLGLALAGLGAPGPVNPHLANMLGAFALAASSSGLSSMAAADLAKNALSPSNGWALSDPTTEDGTKFNGSALAEPGDAVARTVTPTQTLNPMWSPGPASGADAQYIGSGWSSGAASADDSQIDDFGALGPEATPSTFPSAYVDGSAAPDAPASVSAPKPGLTMADVPARTDVTTEPGYFPGEKKTLATALNVAAGAVPVVGLANGLSALLGGPSIGGYIADHSAPGTAVNPSGNGGGYEIGRRYAADVGVGSGSGSSYPASVSSAIAPTSTPSNANAMAQAAYLNAVAHMTKPPAARVAAPVSLIPPKASSSRSFYDLASDPVVNSALRLASGLR